MYVNFQGTRERERRDNSLNVWLQHEEKQVRSLVREEMGARDQDKNFSQTGCSGRLNLDGNWMAGGGYIFLCVLAWPVGISSPFIAVSVIS